QDGVLPTVTLELIPTPSPAPLTPNPLTPPRDFSQQDFEVYIDPEDNDDKIAVKCFNAVRACAAGAQGPRQGHHVVGAPGIYRVLIVGPRGAGRRSQALALAKHFGLVYLHFEDLLNEAKEQTDDIGETLRRHGPSLQLKADIDCIDHGWVLTGYPTSGNEFERLDTMTTPPNRAHGDARCGLVHGHACAGWLRAQGVAAS
ncbi:putative adenylate kinase-like protein C9orf98-like protein, partial [Operophtera brumata]